MGMVATDVTSYVVMGYIDTASIQGQTKKILGILNLVDALKQRLDAQPEPTRQLLRSQVELLQQRAANMRGETVDLWTMVQAQQQPTRQRRSIAALAGIALIGTTLANFLYTGSLHAQIQDARTAIRGLTHQATWATATLLESSRRIDILNSTVSRALHHIQERENHLQQEITGLEETQRLMMTVDTAYRAMTLTAEGISNILKMVQDTCRGDVTAALINPREAKRELRRIRENLPPQMELAFDKDDLNAFYALPMLTQNHGHVLQVVLSIPLINVKDTMTLLRYIPLPIKTTSGLQLLLQGTRPYIATNEQRTLFQEVSNEELAECTPIRRIFLCPHLRVLNKREGTPSCLLALLEGKIEAAQKVCAHTLRVADPVLVVQISTNKFSVTAQTSTTATRTCSGEETSAIIHIPPGRSELVIPQGCAVSTDNLFITPAREVVHNLTDWVITVPIPAIPDINLTLANHYPRMDVGDEELVDIVRELTRYKPTTRLAEVAEIVAQRTRAHQVIISWSGALLSVVASTTIIGAIAWLWYRYHTKEQRTEKRPYYTICRQKRIKGTQAESRGPDSPKRGEFVVE